MKNISFKMWMLFFSIIFLDQSLKIFVKTSMSIGDEFVVFDWFRIYFVENNGFAFGLEFFGLWGKFFLTLFRLFFVFGSQSFGSVVTNGQASRLTFIKSAATKLCLRIFVCVCCTLAVTNLKVANIKNYRH